MLFRSLPTPSTLSVSVASDLKNITASGAFGSLDNSEPLGTYLILPAGDDAGEDLTVRIYRVDDDTAVCDPLAYRAGIYTAKRFKKKLRPKTAQARIHERRGRAYVRTPHLITVESDDYSLALTNKSLVRVVPGVSGRWTIIWATCEANASIADHSIQYGDA